MAKFTQILIPMTFVFIGGLVSCSPERNDIIKDIYKPPAPRLQHGDDSTVELSAGIDYIDRFQFQEPKPSKVRIESHCLRGGDKLNYEYAVNDPRGVEAVGVFELLPPDQLWRDVNADKLVCDFKLQLFNALGSSYVMQVPTVSVHEKGPWPVTLAGTNTDIESPLSIARTHLYKIRYAGRGPVETSLLCKDFASPTMPFDRVADLDRIDFTISVAKTPDLQKQPIQTCRILMVDGRRMQAVSPAFKLLFTPPPLKLAEEPLNYDSYLGFWTAVEANSTDHGPAIARFQLINDGTFERRVRIPRRPINIEATLFLGGHAVPTLGKGFDVVTRPYGAFFLSGLPTESITAEFTQVRIPPGSSLQISVFAERGGFACGNSTFYSVGRSREITLDLLTLRLRDSVEILDIDELGNAIGSYTLSTSRGILLKSQPNSDLNTDRYSQHFGTCRWQL